MAVINNTFSEIDDAAIVKAQLAVTGIVYFSAFQDVTDGVLSDRFFKKELRYSFNGTNFSEWQEFQTNFSSFEIDVISGVLFLEYRYTRSGTNTTGLLSWSAINFDTVNSRSFLSKISSITRDLYPSGWAWKNKINLPTESNPEVIDNYLISFKTFTLGAANFTVSYGPTPAPLWKAPNDQEIGVSAEFVFVNDSVKEIFIYAEDPDALDGNLLIENEDIFELDLSKSKSNTNMVFPFDNKLRRLKGPQSTQINHVDFTFCKIEVLDFSETIFQNANIQLRKVENLYSFVQPSAPWSVSNFTLTDSTIYETLNLNKMAIKGGLHIVDNWFIEEVALNKFGDYSEALVLKFDNCTLLKNIDFSFMNGLLTAQDCKVIATQIGADQASVDAMLSDLKTLTPDNGATGRLIDLRKNAAPSASGQSDKAYLQSIGVQVETE